MRNTGNPKPQSAFTVTRCFPVEHADIAGVEQALSGSEGIEAIELRRRCKGITVRYDSARVGYAEIEQTLSQAGFAFRRSRWTKFKAAWCCFVDENARANANAPERPCCSRPPGTPGIRRKP